MKPAATGRILLWRGGSLWIGLAGEPSGFHSHHAVQIALPFHAGRVRFQHLPHNWKSYGAAIIAAGETHAFEARGQFMAQIFVEPESREGRALQLLCRDEGIASLSMPKLKSDVAALANGYEKQAGDADLVALARATVAKLAGAAPTPDKAADARIARALDLIRQRLSDAIPLKSIAAAVHLSPERFRHLFMEETGVGFRPYLLWLRLESSLAAYVRGDSLTEAAHAGGFADSAHFSRTFKRMFGITPASVRPE